MALTPEQQLDLDPLSRQAYRVREKYEKGKAAVKARADARLAAHPRIGHGVVESGIHHIAGAPFRAVGGLFGRALFGARAKHGPMKGKRLQEVRGGPGRGMREIPISEYVDIISGRVPGKAYEGKIGGKTVYMARNFRPGGLVGFAQRRPIMAAAGALLGYHLLKRPDHAGPVYEFARGFAPPGPSGELDPALSAALQQQPSFQSPLAAGVWK